MKIHELKTWPAYFDAVAEGRKTFEIRKDDRGFNPGDVLELREFAPDDGGYTGRSIWRRVTYITDFAQQPGEWLYAEQGALQEIDAAMQPPPNILPHA